MEYNELRTGLTFSEVRALVVEESERRYDREGQFIRPSRKRILGKWREIKLSLWKHLQEEERSWPSG